MADCSSDPDLVTLLCGRSLAKCVPYPFPVPRFGVKRPLGLVYSISSAFTVFLHAFLVCLQAFVPCLWQSDNRVALSLTDVLFIAYQEPLCVGNSHPLDKGPGWVVSRKHDLACFW